MGQPKEERTVEIIVNGQKANASIKEMEASVAVLNAQWRKMSQDDPGRGKIIEDLNAMKARVTALKSEVTGVSQTTGVMKQAFANAFAIVASGGVMGLIGQVVGLGKAIFETTAKFQTYESVMTNALGDKSKAQKAMADIQQMAAKTPFSVDELTGSFIKFVNRGLQPSMAEMSKLADIAASQGKSFDQLTEAALDAAGGEFERLKEFGIKASKSGDQVSLSFKGITQSVKNTPEAINGAIMAFGSMKGIAGSTAAISATLEGQLSNLGDTTDQLKIKVGEGLKPAFTLILSLFGRFIDWIGRFVEEAVPLKSLFTEISTVVQDFYREIADVLESLGLFSAKTDTVKMAVEALKFVLTLVLLPIRTLYLAAKGLVDVFIDWYNKSEMLRGVLGGLGAVVVSLFTTIKDNALKILGGVGDIIIGIFSLDKNKIVAGFKSAMAATADVMLEGGNKAAEAFAKGYEANKNSHITRTVKVKTTESDNGSGVAAGVDLKSDATAGDASAEKKREAALKKRLAALDKQHKAEAAAERAHQEMLLNLEETVLLAHGNQRAVELGKVLFDAKRKALAVTGTEQEKHAAVALIMEEAHQKQLALQAKFDKEDAAQVKQDVADQLADIEAAELEKEELVQTKFNDAQISEQTYHQQMYEAKRAALEAELALLEMFGGKETAAYQKKSKEMLKLETDHTKTVVADNKKREKTKEEIAMMGMKTAGDVVQTTIDLLFQDEEARRKHHNLYTAMAGAKLIIDGVQEVAQIWMHASEFGPVAGPIIGGVQTALAVARTVFGLTKLQEFSFARGGATGGGLNMAGGKDSSGMAVSPMGTLMEMSGMGIGANGKLMDNSGFAVAGIVHEDEYVVPKWMRQDPQVAAVEQWLEAKRLRGYAEGGATGGATLPAASAAPASDGELTYAVQIQMLQALQLMTGQLADVKDWQTRINVQLNLVELDKGQKELKQVQLENGIR